MSDATAPFLVAPWIEVANIDQGINFWLDPSSAASFVDHDHLTAAVLIRSLLDSLQASNLRNGIRLGYTVGIGVFDLFAQDGSGEWFFDEGALRFYTDLFCEVGRPVVIHLRANHFFGEGPLVRKLLDDESSYARTNDGSCISETYYGNTLFAPVFALDEGIPLNHYRFTGFRRLASVLAAFDRDHPGIIQAYTVAGELHHLMPGLADPASAGHFENVQMTDYSDASIREFRSWLRTRHGGLHQVNDCFSTAFSTWDDVQPPRRDLREDHTAPLWNHMDSYADGILPVFGWAELPEDGSIHLYVDGEYAGQPTYGLNRLDVYEAAKDVRQGNLGFRLDIDYRQLSPGCHRIHAVIQLQSGARYLLARRTIVVGRLTKTATPASMHALDGLPASSGPGLRAWLDSPPENLRLLFNPYAAEWQKFRESQIQALAAKFAEIAVDSGLPPERLYSHQIMAQFEGTWNRGAFAVTSEVLDGDLLTPGITLYGGATVCPGIAPFARGKKCGVTEFHPRMCRWASKDVFLRALDYYQELGFAFVCPYYMSTRPPFMPRAANAVGGLLIHPYNPALGSMYFYSALVEFLNRNSH